MELNTKDAVIAFLVDHMVLVDLFPVEMSRFLSNWRHFQFDDDYVITFLGSLQVLPVLKNLETDGGVFCDLVCKLFEESKHSDDSQAFLFFLLTVLNLLVSACIKNRLELNQSSLNTVLLRELDILEKGTEVYVAVYQLAVELASDGFDTANFESIMNGDGIMSQLCTKENTISGSILLDVGSSLVFQNLILSDPTNGLCISTWIRFRQNTYTGAASNKGNCLLSLSDPDGAECVRFEIHMGKILLKTPSHTECFEAFTFELNVHYHIALAYKKCTNSKAEFTMFVNGENIQTKVISPLFSRMGRDALSMFSLKRFGQPKHIKVSILMHGPNEESNVLFELINLTVLNAHNHKSPVVSLLYYLGPNYSGNFQDCNFLSLLPSKKLINMAVVDSEGKANVKNGGCFFDHTQIVLVFSAINATSDHKGVRYCAYNNDQGLVALIYPTDAAKSYLFPLQNNLLKCLDSCSGIVGFLEKVRTTSSTTQLLESLKNLFFIIDNDNRLMSQFVSIGGYEILAAFFRTNKQLLSIEVLEETLEHIGYMLTNPVESIISNGIAYQALILDFDLWHHPSHNSSEMLKFVLFQLTVFGQDSKYNEFNIKQLEEMKVIKVIIAALEQTMFEVSILPEVKCVLSILIRCQNNTKVIKLIQRYITFSFSKTYEGLLRDKKLETQRESGEMVFDVLISSLCDENGSKSNREALQKLNWRWILGCFMGPNNYKLMSLKLLLCFLNVQSQRYIKGFIGMGGFSLLSSALEDCWQESEIKKLLLARCFDVFFISEQVVFDSEPNTTKSATNMLITGELRTILNDLMEIEARKLHVKNSVTSSHLLDEYTDLLIRARYSAPSLKQEFGKNIAWFHGIVRIFLSEDSNQPLQQFLREIIIEKLFSDELYDFEFIEKFQKIHPVEFNYALLPIIFCHLNEYHSLLSKIISSDDRELNICRLFISFLSSSFDHQIDVIGYMSDLETVGSVIAKCVKKNSSRRMNVSTLTTLIECFCNRFMEFHVYSTLKKNIDQIKASCRIFMSFSMIFKQHLKSVSQVLLFSCFIRNLNITDIACQSVILNCIRIHLMELEDHEVILNALTFDKTVQEEIPVFLSELSHWNDEQAIAEFNSHSEIIDAFDILVEKNSEQYELALVDTPVSEYLLSLQKEKPNFAKEITSFNHVLFNAELKKYNAHIQDREDDCLLYVSQYQLMLDNWECSKLANKYALDNTEGKFRMRNKLMKVSVGNAIETLSPITRHDFISVEESVSEEHPPTGIEDIDMDFDEDKNRRILRNLMVNDKIDEIYNVVDVVGLDLVESVMVVGKTHIYVVENYFVTKDNEILDIDEVPVDKRDVFVNMLKDVTNNGHLIKSSTRSHATKRWPLNKLVAVSKRKFLLRDVALEAFFIDGSSMLITLVDEKRRNIVFDKINSKTATKHSDINMKEALELACNQKIKQMDSDRFKGLKLVDDLIANMTDVVFSDITKRWSNGEISNFYYLMLVNTIAGRTFNDLTQYPVFPFVLRDYTSETLDLSDSSIYRDFGKPMGAQKDSQEAHFKERYQLTAEMGESHPFNYGTHYSSAMIVCSYLIRISPFTESYLKLQGGNFDHADRLFSSISKLWSSATSSSTDVRELIPEFYYLPDFLVNGNDLELGETQAGVKIGNVELPKWAQQDPVRFVRIMREALESEYVSDHLNEWIDLVFGYKQQGAEAIEATNVFHQYSYPGRINLENVKDVHERGVITSIIHNFGQTPLQIFHRPHPKRKVRGQEIGAAFQKTFGGNVTVSECELPDRDFLYDQYKGQWMEVPWNVRVLVREEHENIKVIVNGTRSIVVNDRYQFEELSQVSGITSCEIVAKGQFLVGFDSGVVRVFEVNSDIFKHVTNAQKDAVMYEARQVSLFGSKGAGEKLKSPLAGSRGLFLRECVALRGGPSEPVVKMRVLREEGVVITMCEDRKELNVWRLGEGIGHMRQIPFDESIVDFDVSSRGNKIYVLQSELLSVWTISGMRASLTPIEDATCVVCLDWRDGLSKRGDLIGVGFADGRVDVLNVQLQLVKRIDTELERVEAAGLAYSSGTFFVALAGHGKTVYME